MSVYIRLIQVQSVCQVGPGYVRYVRIYQVNLGYDMLLQDRLCYVRLRHVMSC